MLVYYTVMLKQESITVFIQQSGHEVGVSQASGDDDSIRRLLDWKGEYERQN